MKLIDLLVSRQRDQTPYFENYLTWSKKIKQVTETLVGEARVIIFGSVLRSPPETPRDIDVLIISPRFADLDTRRMVRTSLWDAIGMSSPFEFHLVTPETYEDWYRHFLANSSREI